MCGYILFVIAALLLPPEISMKFTTTTSATVVLIQPEGSPEPDKYRLQAVRLTGPQQPRCPEVDSTAEAIATDIAILTELEEISIYKLTVTAMYLTLDTSVTNYTFFSTLSGGKN